MNRTTTLLLTVVLVIGSVSAFPMASAAQDTSVASSIGDATYAQEDANASENASDVRPGERLSGVIGVGQAEIEGEMEQRTYGIEFAMASTNDSKAAVVADRLDRIQQRLTELEQQKEELREARENGSISEGQFQARMAELGARTETVEQLATASEARANSLPADVLEANGVNVTAIQTLKMQAQELSGGEIAEIAKSIAGEKAGQSVSQGPPEDVGMPGPDEAGDGDRGADEAEAAIDRAESQLDAAETRLAQAEERVGENASENASAALEQAREGLDRARQALADARAALDNGDGGQALDHAEDALSHAAQAESHAQDAIDEATTSGQDGDGSDQGTPTEGGDGAGDGQGDGGA